VLRFLLAPICLKLGHRLIKIHVLCYAPNSGRTKSTQDCFGLLTRQSALIDTLTHSTCLPCPLSRYPLSCPSWKPKGPQLSPSWLLTAWASPACSAKGALMLANCFFLLICRLLQLQTCGCKPYGKPELHTNGVRGPVSGMRPLPR
jgi:hypothetical protein